MMKFCKNVLRTVLHLLCGAFLMSFMLTLAGFDLLFVTSSMLLAYVITLVGLIAFDVLAR